tara:strand:- start:116 stop:1195 length:1080 start_codon:yes stop_codon:yes gene_type:complete
MTKAAELAKMGEVLTNSQIGGRRNIIINGAMQVAQRGTSSTGVGASNGVYPTVDRFIFEAGNTAGRLTMTQETISDLSGFTKAIKLACTTADTSVAADEFLMLGQRFEGQDLQQLKKGTSDAEKVTVSFYVKGNANATYTLELRDNDNSRSNSQEFSVTTSWNRVSMTFDGDTSGALDNDNALSLKCNIWLHGGSTYTGGTHTSNTWHGTNNQRVGDNQTSFFDSTDRTFFVTGWQMEVGSQATPFEHRSFGEELDLCERYFKRLEVGNNTRISTAAYADTTSRARFVIYHTPEMRQAPTAAETNLDLEGTDTDAIATAGTNDLSDVIITRSAGSHSTGDILQVHTGSTVATLDFDAEL